MEERDSAGSEASKPAEVADPVAAAPVPAARTAAQNRILTKLLDELIFHARAEVQRQRQRQSWASAIERLID